MKTKQLMDLINIHSMGENTMEVNGVPSTVWLLTFFKISSFVFRRNLYRFGTTWGWI